MSKSTVGVDFLISSSYTYHFFLKIPKRYFKGSENSEKKCLCRQCCDLPSYKSPTQNTLYSALHKNDKIRHITIDARFCQFFTSPNLYSYIVNEFLNLGLPLGSTIFPSMYLWINPSCWFAVLKCYFYSDRTVLNSRIGHP
jgi:hypothetical protein